MSSKREWDSELEKNESERPAQMGSEVMKPLLAILGANDNDPAYLVGEMAGALSQLAHEVSKYPHDTPEAVMIQECSDDLRRLRHEWLARYPDLVAKYEGR